MAAYSEDLEQARTAHAEIADEAAGALRAAGRAADATARSGDAAGEIVAAANFCMPILWSSDRAVGLA